MAVTAVPSHIPTPTASYQAPLSRLRIETAVKEALIFVRDALGIPQRRNNLFPGVVCFMAQLNGPAGSVELKFHGNREVFEISIAREPGQASPPEWAASYTWKLSFGRFRLQEPEPELQRIVSALHRLIGELGANRLEIQFVVKVAVSLAPGIVLERIKPSNSGWYRALVVDIRPNLVAGNTAAGAQPHGCVSGGQPLNKNPLDGLSQMA